ncbi:MAG: V-type ATP synthase subunit A, partial [Elusimicrobia bacterium]|nr:V-type ATP synthase subunit A [Elusimicrobiota bacterium]
MSGGRIVKVSGPLVIASDLSDVKMYDVVKVGWPQLIGEVIGLDGNTASIQVYEETAGIGPDEPVVTTSEPLSVELGPGLIGGIYDGIQRPLTVIREMSGNWIARGIDIPNLDRKRKWTFKPTRKKGDQVITGDIIGTVQETELVVQKIMVPPGIAGEVTMIKAGDFTVEETVCQIKQNGESKDVRMSQHWPVRKMRPVKEKLPPLEPLVTGQRVIDTFFPVAKGGTACIPGPFGSGKCVTGDTPVLLANGQLELISDIYEKNKNHGKRTISDGEEYTVLDRPLEVFTYQNGKINQQKVSAVYKGKTTRIIEIKTRTGRTAKVTPIHKLFIINGSLEIVEQEAWKL